MEFTDIQKEYKNMLEKLAELTNKTTKEIEEELNNTQDLETLLQSAAEMFQDE